VNLGLSDQNIVAVEDINLNGADEIAVAQYAPWMQESVLTVIDSQTRREVSSVVMSGGFRSIDLESFVDRGNSRLAWLLLSPAGASDTVQIRSPLDGSLVASLDALPLEYTSLDLETFQDSDGRIQIAILGYLASTRSTCVRTVDLESGTEQTWFSTDSTWKPRGLEILRQNEVPVFAILRSQNINGGIRSQIQLQDMSGASLAIQAIGSEVSGVDAGDPDNRFSAFVNSLVTLVSPLDGSYKIVEYDENLLTRHSSSLSDGKIASAIDIQSGTDGEAARITVLLSDPVTSATFTRTILTDDGTSVVIHQGNGFDSTQLATFCDNTGQSASAVILQSNEDIGQSRLRFSAIDHAQHFQTVPIVDHGASNVAAWYDENRVQLHTRGGAIHPNPAAFQGFYDTPESLLAAQAVRSLGAKVLTRHVKARDEDPWWPSFSPSTGENSAYGDTRNNGGITLPAGRNLVQEYLDEARVQGVHLIDYYWLSSEATLAASHPEWICLDAARNPISHPVRGFYLDLASEYGNVVRDRLIELASMGAEAFYFDAAHIPINGSWHGAYEQAFVAATGLVVPSVSTDPTYRDWIRFRATFLAGFFDSLTKSVQAQFPHVQMLISSAPADQIFDEQADSRLSASGIAKSEFRAVLNRQVSFFSAAPSIYKPSDDIRMAFSWTLLRGASGGAPPHIWYPYFSDESQVQSFVGSLLTYGAIANIDVPEQNLLVANNPVGVTTREVVRSGVKLGNLLSPFLAGTEPEKFAAVYFSESQRNPGLGRRANYAHVTAPAYGAFEAFRRRQLSVDVLNDTQVSATATDLSAYKVIFVSNMSEMTEVQRSHLQTFRDAGGILIENNPSWEWTTTAGYSAAKTAVLNLAVANVTPALSTIGGNENMHLQVHINKADRAKRTIMISNEFGFVGAENSVAPAPITDLKIKIQYEDGFNSNTSFPIEVINALTGDFLQSQREADGWTIAVPSFSAVMAIQIISRTIGVATDEDTIRRFGASDFQTIPSGETVDSLVSVTVNQLNLAAGDTLKLNQGSGPIEVQDGMTIPIRQLPVLVFTPAQNSHGVNRSTFHFTANHANGGTRQATLGINVLAVNDRPRLTMIEPSVLPYAPEAAATFVTSALMLNDPDKEDFVGATIRISAGYQPGDTLSFTPIGSIDGAFDSAAGILTLSGLDTLANYETALRSVTYASESRDPGSRTITFQVKDGGDLNNQSAAVSRVVGGQSQLVGSVLMIYGTDQSNQIRVSKNGSVLINVDGQVARFSSLLVTSICIYGFGENDSISVSSNVIQPAKLFGGAGNDSLLGGAGNDQLDGGGGSDSLAGGLGDDIYIMTATSSQEADLLFEGPDRGVDTVDFSSLSTSVGFSVSTLSVQQVHINRTIQISSVASFENIIGGNGADTLSGNSLANFLVGGPGNDQLGGATGSDVLVGGTGNDRYVFRRTISTEADLVTELNGEGEDSLSFTALAIPVIFDLSSTEIQAVHTSRTIRLSSGGSIENLVGGVAADVLKGNVLNNTLIGNKGNDLLDGQGGSDILAGGLGDDIYVMTAAFSAEADSLWEGISSGIDTIDFSDLSGGVNVSLALIDVQQVHSNRTLRLNSGNNFENLSGGSGTDNLVGNAAANVLIGNDENDQLVGSHGRDFLIGGNGQDFLRGGNDDDLLISGRTVYDASLRDLNSLRILWLSSELYSLRVSKLLAGTGSPAVSLTAGVKVLTDATPGDSLEGGAGKDFFFVDLDDVIADLFAEELVHLL
jgi:Ca2+-binding RTX toxin-like protein